MSFESFQNTLRQADRVLDDNYEGSRELAPVTFPEPAAEFPSVPEPRLAETGTVQIRSLKAPKFSVEYNVPLTESVFMLKERLLSDPAQPLGDPASLSTNGIKLLLKAKVVSDTRQLAELPSLAFTAVVAAVEPGIPVVSDLYWGAQAAPAQPKSAPAEVPQPVKKPGINDQFWREVETIARKYVDDPKELVQSLRQVTDMDLD